MIEATDPRERRSVITQGSEPGQHRPGSNSQLMVEGDRAEIEVAGDLNGPGRRAARSRLSSPRLKTPANDRSSQRDANVTYVADHEDLKSPAPPAARELHDRGAAQAEGAIPVPVVSTRSQAIG